jgi:hypothetical protein
MSDNIPTIDTAAIKRCPHSDGGIVLRKMYDASTFIEWKSEDGEFLGVIERLPGRPPILPRPLRALVPVLYLSTSRPSQRRRDLMTKARGRTKTGLGPAVGRVATQDKR